MNILIVEDETPIREWVQYSIERSGRPELTVSAAVPNAERALEVLAGQHIDIIITDIRMPGMSGLELMKIVKAEQPHLAFLILTNYAEFSYAREALAIGASSYLLKSELQGSDIVDALLAICQETDRILVDKDEDCYASGYLDLYDLYRRRDDAEFRKAFWLRHHFAEEKKFRIIGIQSEDLFRKSELDRILKDTGLQTLRPAMVNGKLFIVLQAESRFELEDATERFLDRIVGERELLAAAGAIREGVGEVMNAISEADRMLLYRFLSKAGAIRWSDVNGPDFLDRKSIRERGQELLASIRRGSEEEPAARIRVWYSELERPSFHDIEWVRDTAIFFVSRMEEICFGSYLDERLNRLDMSRFDLFDCRDQAVRMAERYREESESRYSDTVRDAIRYIRMHYRDPELSLAETASAVYRSPDYLGRLFKQETGKNFSAFLTDLRIGRAKELLAEGNSRVYEIATEVGYSNASYFTRQFRENTGLTPDQARGKSVDGMSEK